jgi:hypothetical protein
MIKPIPSLKSIRRQVFLESALETTIQVTVFVCLTMALCAVSLSVLSILGVINA